MLFKIVGTTLVLLACLVGTTYADEIKPFISDGCSAFPDGTLEQQDLWLECCVDHDKAYWKGGTYQQRLNADENLRICVADVGKPLIAELMLAGVRVGGSPYLPAKFRWGYGWPYLRGYKALKEEEKVQISAVDGK